MASPTLPSRFELERHVGSGAFGDVWAAFDGERQERVALKLLRQDRLASLAHFKREFRQLAGIVHPNLVTLYELFAHDDRWFFTMEFVDGVDFLQFARSENVGALGAARYSRLEGALAQLVCGVAALHDHGMIHRDLKPSNVRVAPDGRVVVLDFGLVTDAPTRSLLPGYLVGSPAYVAPELMAGVRASPATDWYAIGTILFECLTGKLPFDGAPRAVLRAKTEGEAPSAASFAPELPPRLVDECAALLRRDPANRSLPSSFVVHEPPEGSSTLEATGAPFVGRRAELDALETAFADVEREGAITVFLEGPSGTGKSSLLRQFLSAVSVQHPEALILSGRCHEHEAIPYQALDGAIDALARVLMQLPAAALQNLRESVDGAALSPLFPVLAPLVGEADDAGRLVSAPERRRRGFAALRQVFSVLGERQRVILVMDDLQWGDVDGAKLLGELTTREDAPRMLVIASFRSEATANSPCLSTLRDFYSVARKEVRRISLEPLSVEDALLLARTLRPGAAPEVWANLLQESQRHPFFLTELARARGAASAVTLPTLFEERLQSLAPEERYLLELLAVAARPPTHELLVKAATGVGAVPLTSPLRVLRRLRAERLVSSDASRDRLDLYHDRVREAVALQIPAERLRRCHRAFAEALEAREELDHELLVHHWRDAGEHPRAQRHAVAAAERADAALAFARAATFYGLALDLVPEDAVHARPLHERRGQALWNAGQGRQAAQSFLAAAEGTDGLDRLELKRRAAESLLYVGDRIPGLAVLDEVLRGVGLRRPRTGFQIALDIAVQFGRLLLRGLRFRHLHRGEQAEKRARLQMDICYSAEQSLGWSDPTVGAAFVLRGVRIALDSGDRRRAARFLSEYAILVAIARGKREAAEPILRRALELAEQSGDNSVLGKVKCNIGNIEVNLLCFRDSVATLDRAIALMREKCIGVDWDIYNGELLRMGAMHLAGQSEGLVRHYPPVCQEVDARGNVHAAINIRVGTGFRVELLRGKPEEALRVLDEAVQLAGGTLNPIQEQLYTVAMVDTLLHQGRQVEAAAFIDGRWPALRRSPVMRVPLQRKMLLDAQARAHGRPGTLIAVS